MSNPDEIIFQMVTALASLRGPNVSRHFDELSIAKEAYAVEFWRRGSLTALVKKFRDYGEPRTILIVFDLGCSNTISRFENYSAPEKYSANHPPTIYLIEGVEFFNIVNEDYRKKLDLFEDEGLICLLRSWRDDQAASRSWEFNNAIYAWSPACMATPAPVR